MENQPIEQEVQQPTAQPIVPTGGQTSSTNLGYGAAVVVVIVIALGVAYFLMNPAGTETAGEATTSQLPMEQTTTAAPTVGNTTADISAELNQIPDTSANLDADAASSASDLQNL